MLSLHITSTTPSISTRCFLLSKTQTYHSKKLTTGDVIYHSIVDAIFGALTLPDIGQVFQDTDPRWKGCDSSKFMEHAFKVMKYYGYKVGNLDVTLILERPKVADVKPMMKENIVKLLGTTEGRVNIKARTHEKMDSVGELRSLSCHVVVTLEKE
jgi:2-C-methyl-D-erythritol 2,4-cyclodiphosphate synthase